jgi:hypothetical protein
MFITMHGSENVKFASVQQAKQTYRYKNKKEKSCKTNISIQEHERKIVQNKHIDTRTRKKDRAKQTYRYKNEKERSCKTNISIQEQERKIVKNKGSNVM